MALPQVEMTSNTTANTASTTTAAAAAEFEPPLACVRRILKHTLPAATNVGKDASAAFARACGIFIIYVTACANDFAREHKRQTITANDVLAAITELDFDDFTADMMAQLEAYRETEKEKKEAKASAKKAQQEKADADQEEEVEVAPSNSKEDGEEEGTPDKSAAASDDEDDEEEDEGHDDDEAEEDDDDEPSIKRRLDNELASDEQPAAKRAKNADSDAVSANDSDIDEGDE